MPSAIPVSLADVQATEFSNLPYGEYLGEVDILKYKEATETAGAKLQITYVVIDGDQINRKSTEFRPLSEKSYGFLKAFFNKFGFTEEDYADPSFLDYDEDTMEIIGPAAEILGAQVIFRVKAQGKKRGTDEDFVVTELVRVEEMSGQAVTRETVEPQVAEAAAELDQEAAALEASAAGGVTGTLEAAEAVRPARRTAQPAPSVAKAAQRPPRRSLR